MAQQVKKIAHNHTDSKMATEETLRIVSDTEEKVIKISRDGIEGVLREVDNFNRFTLECIRINSSALSASIESGNATSKSLRELGNQLIGNFNRSFLDNTEFFKEIFACRNFNDIVNWHEDAWQKTINRYFDEVNVLIESLFDGCGKAFEPLQEHSTNTSHQLRKVMRA